MRGPLATTWRGARLIGHLFTGLAMAAVVALDFSKRLSRERMSGWWQRRLLKILNIQVTIEGAAVSGARLTVANHVSWLDIPLIGACEDTRFIAKSDIRHWPIAGWLADGAGSFYIRRGRGGARPLLDRLVPHLQNGGTVTLFPEGTTTDGRQVLPFHSRLFAAAVEAGCVVQPLALEYGTAADGSAIAPFVGDDELVGHVLRILREPQLRVRVVYGTPIVVAAQNRDELAQQAHAAISAALGLQTAAATLPSAARTAANEHAAQWAAASAS